MRYLLSGLLLAWAAGLAHAAEVEQWGLFELTMTGPAEGNPFAEVELSATFTQGDRSVTAAGFYDGDGVYRVRFMPPTTGEWAYSTTSNRSELAGKTGKLTATKPSPGNRGPVRVRNTYHFAHADGTPYFPVGTTCYAWTHQPAALEEQTLATLKTGPFNKLRMCVLPKWYAFNKVEPPRYPFAGSPPNKWEFDRFNPEFFRHLETRIGQLRDLGIEADVILFHPYDEGHWGFDRMPAAADDRYLRYVVARLAAYRNVWWSVANEFDFMKTKTDADWERFIKVVAAADPYRHLLSIHNGTRLFNHTNPLLTHASIQNGSAVSDFGRAVLYRDVYRKPVVFDEVKYEGDFEQRWGNLSAEEMVHRFWQGTIAGTYVGHGETYQNPDDLVWWSKGGKFRGKSPERITFLRKVLEDGPKDGIEPIDKWQDERTAGKKGEYYLVYFGKEKPTGWAVDLPLSRGGTEGPLTLTAEVLDTWNMTARLVPGTFTLKPSGRYRLTADPPATIPLPGKPYTAVRLRAVASTPAAERKTLAFPEAEGYGRFAVGGRGGKVYEVTNLNDSGPGSLREAVEASGPRTVVFRVGGVIPLKSKLVVRNPYLTVAGQTAPGDGICVKNYTFGCFYTHDVIIRHVRIRVGDESGKTQDGCGARGCDHTIFDHCSISWSIDEGFSSREAENITVQRCLIAEALNLADHEKYKGTGKGHSFAASISGDVGSFHHNLLANCAGRNWSLAGGLDRSGKVLAGRLDIRNNVVYNWAHRTTDGGVRGLNFVNNFYLPGPASRVFTLLKPDPGDPERGMRAYMAGNIIDGKPEFDADNWKAYVGPADGLAKARSEKPLYEPFVETHTAREAFESVLANVGATRPKQDAVDRRVIADVSKRGHTFTGSRGKLPGIIDSQADAGGWPGYKSAESPPDTDHDGMPDEWEKRHGLNPSDPADGAALRNDGYTNLEHYLNELATRRE
ncbi:MAG TPA: DUF5060 domain-containing protein [Gemmataceae bacterium]|nr:DUF5060 domain-containing protein [Gemmataceae bacterium]